MNFLLNSVRILQGNIPSSLNYKDLCSLGNYYTQSVRFPQNFHHQADGKCPLSSSVIQNFTIFNYISRKADPCVGANSSAVKLKTEGVKEELKTSVKCKFNLLIIIFV